MVQNTKGNYGIYDRTETKVSFLCVDQSRDQSFQKVWEWGLNLEN